MGCSKLTSRYISDHPFFQETIPWTKNARGEDCLPLFHDLTIRVPVLTCKQELRGHGETPLGADISALGTEDALGDIDADTFCFREKFDGMGRTDL